MIDFAALQTEYRATLATAADRAAEATKVEEAAAAVRSELDQIDIQIDELSAKTGQDDLLQRLTGKKPSSKPTTDMQTLEIERRRLQATLTAATLLANNLREQAGDAKRIAKGIIDDIAQAEYRGACDAVVTAYRAFEQVFASYSAALSEIGGSVSTRLETVSSSNGEVAFVPPDLNHAFYLAAAEKLKSRTMEA